jgi:hypothetical protein
MIREWGIPKIEEVFLKHCNLFRNSEYLKALIAVNEMVLATI